MNTMQYSDSLIKAHMSKNIFELQERVKKLEEKLNKLEQNTTKEETKMIYIDVQKENETQSFALRQEFGV